MSGSVERSAVSIWSDIFTAESMCHSRAMPGYACTVLCVSATFTAQCCIIWALVALRGAAGCTAPLPGHAGH